MKKKLYKIYCEVLDNKFQERLNSANRVEHFFEAHKMILENALKKRNFLTT